MKTPLRVFLALLGAFIQAVGLCNIHAFANVTEGGVLGATLLLEHWLLISPALSALVLNILCYLFGWKTLGKEFLIYSAICSGAYSLFYALLAPYAPLWPGLVASPLWSALVGALFIGIGCGIFALFGKFDALENIDGDTLALVGILALVVVTAVVCKIIQFFKKK